MLVKLILGFSIICISSCNRSICNCYNDGTEKISSKSKDSILWKTTEIDTKPIRSLVKNLQADEVFGLYLYARQNGDYYFTFLSSADSIVFINLAKQESFDAVSYKENIKQGNSCNILFENDTLHFVDLGSKKYFRYALANDFLLTKIDSVDLTPSLTDCYLMTRPNAQALAYSYPCIYIPYGHNKKASFIDSKAFLRVDVRTKKIEKIADFPDCFRCSYIYDAHSSIRANRDGSIVYLFNKFDKLFSLRPGEKKSTTYNLDHLCAFEAFDKKKEQNLAYVRKYLDNEEKNLSLFNVLNKYTVVVKRNAKKLLADKNTYSMYVFDSVFNQVATKQIEHPVFSPCIYEYKNGILIFNDSLNKAYYYDFKK